MKLEIHGLDDLESKLKDGADLDLVKDLMKKHGSEMQKNAMRRARVDSGALKRSIQMSTEDGGFTVRVGSTMEYAPYVEYGTGIYASNGMGRRTPWFYYNAKLGHVVQTSGMMAKPFMRPSFYEQRNKLIKDLRKIMK